MRRDLLLNLITKLKYLVRAFRGVYDVHKNIWSIAEGLYV